MSLENRRLSPEKIYRDIGLCGTHDIDFAQNGLAKHLGLSPETYTGKPNVSLNKLSYTLIERGEELSDRNPLQIAHHVRSLLAEFPWLAAGFNKSPRPPDATHRGIADYAERRVFSMAPGLVGMSLNEPGILREGIRDIIDVELEEVVVPAIDVPNLARIA